MSPKEKEKFAGEFLGRFLKHGFGTMPKREMEILIFKHLYRSSKFFEKKDNYDISNELQISEARVKTLKTDLHLKFPDIESKEALKEIARRLFDTYETKTVKNEKEFQFVLEDPVLKRELENAAKKHGYFTDGSFNSEIIKIAPTPFIRIFLDVFKDDADFQQKFETALAKQTTDEEKELKIFQSTDSTGEKIEKFLAKHQNKIDVALGILSIASPFNFKLGGSK